jgi:hypothetical protein
MRHTRALTLYSGRINVGDAAMISTTTILHGVDALVPIEELEGLPKAMWFWMR